MKQPAHYLQTRWVQEMTDAMVLSLPDMTREEIEEIVLEEYMKRFTDTECTIYNSYENMTMSATLGTVCDWLEKEKPLVAESGVYFYPKDKKRNVNTEIIKECMLDRRTILKGEMKAALKAGDAFTASVKNIGQGNSKKAANSGYGAEGQPSSFLFNVHSAMSVTASGRGQLSTAMLAFDNFFADSVKFWNMDEFFTFINHIMNEKKSWKYDTFSVIDKVPGKNQWVKRFERKFLHWSLYDESIIQTVYDSLNDEMRARTYYKCSFEEFLLRNHLPRNIYTDIAETSVDFIDPNKIPDELKCNIDRLSAIMLEFVGYRYSSIRYQDKARYERRKVVILSDTDSCFLAFGSVYRFLKNKILPYKLFRKGKDDPVVYKLRVLNVLAVLASAVINDTLWNYLGNVHVAEEDRKYIKMKNEFYYKRVVVTYAKKSYVGYLLRQEEVVLPKPKIDVKGLSFFKSTASENTSNFIYDELLMKQFFNPKGDKMSLKSIYRTIHEYQERMSDEIRAGDIGYLKRAIKVKSKDAYADPLKQYQYKAVYTWNYINGDTGRIELPASVTIVKVVLRDKKDIANLAPWPEVYNRMLELFETNPEFGDHLEVKDGKTRMVKGKGVKAIAMPDDLDEVPDWLLSIIDVETLVNNNMSLFSQLNRALGFTPGTTSHNGSTMQYYTNIVRI